MECKRHHSAVVMQYRGAHRVLVPVAQSPYFRSQITTPGGYARQIRMKRDAHDGVSVGAVGKGGAESMIEFRSEGWGELINVSAAL